MVLQRRETVLKKLLLLTIVIALALALDGALTYDLFDFRVDTFSKLLAVALILGILVMIAWADASKKHDKENNSR